MNELIHSLNIRPHHLLCILGFRGLGYSEKFVSNMEEVAKKLRSDFTSFITLVLECDAICAACPHNVEGKCLKSDVSEVEVAAMDTKCLQKLGFKAGDSVSADEVWKRVKERITLEDIKEICRDCEWWELKYCLEGLKKLKIS